MALLVVGVVETYIGVGGGYSIAAFVGCLLQAAVVADLGPLLFGARWWRRGLVLRRQVLPDHVAAGQPVAVWYGLTGPRPPRATLIDAAPPGLVNELPEAQAQTPGGPDDPAAVGRRRRRQRRAARRARRPAAVPADRPATMWAVHRGLVEFGPLRVRRIGPLGLGRLDLVVEQPTRLTVWPAWAACGQPQTRGASLDAVGRAGPPVASAEDTMLRDYRPGDEWRRVHWRSTARRQRLMTRAEEPAQLPLAVVQAGVAPGAAPAAAELALSLAASV
ncbi:MAG: DUF58 domain-containing protein, partial [Propionibacteriaceae bacterium]|nr:DUF58 domain-containing protein [Propionibacteriaceae bacterium]